MKTIGVGSSPIPSTSKHTYSSSSASSSGTLSPIPSKTWKWVEGEDKWGDDDSDVDEILFNINEFNKKQASEGKKEFVTESDLAAAWNKEFGDDDDDNDDRFYSMPPQKGSGRKRVLDEEDYYPFPVFNKKWVKVE